jgi:hypothetical protein
MARRKKITYKGRNRIVEYFDDKEKPSTGSGSVTGGNKNSESENANKKVPKTG